MLCVAVWTFVHYNAQSDTIPQRWNLDIAKNVLNTTNVDEIEIYHERYLFRDIMMVFAHLVTITYASLITASPCSSACKTPFGMFALAVTIINVLRLAVLFVRAYFDFHRLREVCSEIRYFKSWRNEKRLKEHAIPAVVSKNSFNIYTLFEGILLCACMVFLGLATIWVESGECIDTCNKGYILTNHLVVALFMVEAMYLLSVIALVFFRRTSGLERAESAIDAIYRDGERQRQQKKERVALINEMDDY
jgi:hypothetical protein